MEISFFETILYRPLFNLLFLIYKAVGFESIGWAVLILIVFIRFATWPLFSKSVRYQRRSKLPFFGSRFICSKHDYAGSCNGFTARARASYGASRSAKKPNAVCC